VTVKLPVAVLPESSTAVQVTAVTPSGKAFPEGAEQTTATEPLLSVAVTMYSATGFVWQEAAIMDIFAGTVSTGLSRSSTVTVKLLLARLLAASLAVQTTVVIPIAKAEPDGGRHTTVAPGWLSVTVTW
jgi:hypothetical protein